MNDNRNMMAALALCAALFLGWEYFIAAPHMKAEEARQAAITHEQKAGPATAAPGVPQPGGTEAHLSRTQALSQSGARVLIDTPSVDGSFTLKGGRFDDLRLKQYRETIDPKSAEIVLLAPKGTDYPFYANFGWVGENKATPVPGDATPWKQIGGSVLSPDKPVVLQWDNGQGLVFTRTISVDDKFMFTVSDAVTNKSGAKVTLYPYAYVARDGAPQTAMKASWMSTLHEGFVGVLDGALNDPTYGKFEDDGTPPLTVPSTGGWAGITDKYWMAAVIPPQDQKFQGTFQATRLNPSAKTYQANYLLDAQTLQPGGTATVTQHLFAGAKVFDMIRAYQHGLNIELFDRAIDWGWFILITQPLFWLLDKFYHYIGNFGLAILLLTVVVKLFFFPIANAQYKSMSKMKKVQPQMEALKQRFADDPQKQQTELMELYKREKVNPLAGCLPMLLIIPVFFSLYKVMFVTIEMRHAPFFGWIKDLSAPDPTTIINLFGLLPFHVPNLGPINFLSIGIWPILMGMTQWVQTKLNPTPADPIQARMFAFMPLIFTFMFATFPAGLVIYYTWNNLLSVTQQYVIMRRQGVPVHLTENFRIPGWAKNLFGGRKPPANA
jgi:YidC/Oxa1 family membrane protein insertase